MQTCKVSCAWARTNDASDKRRIGSGKAVAMHVDGKAFHWEGIPWRERLHLMPCPDDEAHALLGDNVELLEQPFFAPIQERLDGIVGGASFFYQRLRHVWIEAEEALMHRVKQPFHAPQFHQQVKVTHCDRDRLFILVRDVHVPKHELHQQIHRFVAGLTQRACRLRGGLLSRRISPRAALVHRAANGLCRR